MEDDKHNLPRANGSGYKTISSPPAVSSSSPIELEALSLSGDSYVRQPPNIDDQYTIPRHKQSVSVTTSLPTSTKAPTTSNEARAHASFTQPHTENPDPWSNPSKSPMKPPRHPTATALDVWSLVPNPLPRPPGPWPHLPQEAQLFLYGYYYREATENEIRQQYTTRFGSLSNSGGNSGIHTPRTKVSEATASTRSQRDSSDKMLAEQTEEFLAAEVNKQYFPQRLHQWREEREKAGADQRARGPSMPVPGASASANSYEMSGANGPGVGEALTTDPIVAVPVVDANAGADAGAEVDRATKESDKKNDEAVQATNTDKKDENKRERKSRGTKSAGTK